MAVEAAVVVVEVVDEEDFGAVDEEEVEVGFNSETSALLNLL